jgi:organic hydroperoxide reductase OsmC/OhrA
MVDSGHVASVGAKRFEYLVSVGDDGSARAEGRSSASGLTWSPEHLLLESLLRCSLQSLRFHADRANVAVEGGGVAIARVSRPAGEQRMRVVDVRCRLAIRLDALTGSAAVEQLLADAEHDCFVGATLKAEPVYEWLVNGGPRKPAGIPSGLRRPRAVAPEHAADSWLARGATAGLVCDRCGQDAPRGDLAEWHAWNRFDLSIEELADDVAVHILICAPCRIEEQSPDELGGGD